MPSLLTANPRLARQWHPPRNGSLTPRDVTRSSAKRVWWICGKNHEWEATVNSRNNGNGCPYCAGSKACADNCLATLNPGLASEWHPGKNEPLTPKDVTLGSYKKVWWLCINGHSWEARVTQRNGGTGCPHCYKQAMVADNNLQMINPQLASEWHPNKNNNLTPRDVTPYSSKRVWWLCARGHEWQATIANRSRGRGCPCCAGRIISEDNCLQTINPKLAAEWHPSRNGSLTPKDVTPGSPKKAWWRCAYGHEWEAQINGRNRGSGCPYCRGRKL